jgi:ribulose-phosphate 3-epimerase
MTKVIPGILTNSIDELKKLMLQTQEVVDRVHIDIIDGIFVNNQTIEPSALGDFDTKLLIDYHLMVNNPEGWLARCANSMADRVFGHIEMMENQMNFVEKSISFNLETGLALDMKSGVEKLDEEALSLIDALIIMGVNAGFGGQEFKKEALKKIEGVCEIRDKNNLNFEIIVDGGVNNSNLKDIIEKGASSVVVGNRIYRGNLEENINALLSNL